MVMARNGGRHFSRNRYGAPLEYAFILAKGRPRYTCLLRDKLNVGGGRQRGDSYRHRTSDGSFRRSPQTHTYPYGIRPAIWHYAAGTSTAGEKYAYEHPALMPEKLAEDHILSWSKVGDLVFDPFAGAGTTMKMALLNFRRYLGFEANAQYVEIARRRIRDVEAVRESRMAAYHFRA
jgi:site-specific DNA-methyltransferase (adenine-specific)